MKSPYSRSVATAIAADDIEFAAARPVRIPPVAEENVHVEAARIPDRDRLVQELQEAGIDARPVDEVTIEVPITGELEAASDELLAQTEHVIMSLGAPFVPVKHEGVIYIRPPVS
jgi:hypothetical protein